MTRKKGACAFCGTYGKLTKEDGWPRWLNTVLPRPGAPGTAHNILFGLNEEIERHERRTVVAHNTERLPFFCGTCNGGWMSRLEEEAKPILIPLLLGTPAMLSMENQEVIARWVTKTALVMEFKNPERRAIPDEQLRWFGNEQRPLPGSMIFIARYVGDKWATSRLRFLSAIKVEGDPLRPDVHLVTYCAGQFVFQVLFSWPAGVIPVRDDASFAIRLFPYEGKPKPWPPTLSLTTEMFYAFGLLRNSRFTMPEL